MTVLTLAYACTHTHTHTHQKNTHTLPDLKPSHVYHKTDCTLGMTTVILNSIKNYHVHFRRAKCTLGIYNVLSPYECCIEQLCHCWPKCLFTPLCCAGLSPCICEPANVLLCKPLLEHLAQNPYCQSQRCELDHNQVVFLLQYRLVQNDNNTFYT